MGIMTLSSKRFVFSLSRERDYLRVMSADIRLGMRARRKGVIRVSLQGMITDE
jgi:hypothetical protein